MVDRRDKAPGLFLSELEAAFRKIATLAQIGKPHPDRPGVRSILLPKTRVHLFHRHTEAQVHLVVIWSAFFGEDAPL